MDSAGLRQEKEKKGWSTADSDKVDKKEKEVSQDGNVNVPRYIIDLSLPPIKRYQQIAKAFKFQTASLSILFDELVQSLHPHLPLGMVHSAAQLLLRRVYNREQTEELKGIHIVTGIKMYLLVAFNVVLDLLMGCTSGGLNVQSVHGQSKMLHFRTLDWGMDALRKVVVQLDFINKPDGPIVASSVTYVGYVGVLTGVKKGLSMSLNFRPNHNASTWLSNFRFYFHHLMVLLGFRPSISSLLRGHLLPNRDTTSNQIIPSHTLASIEGNLPATRSTAAYLIFSDGTRTITMEKDFRSAEVKSAEDFIAITNHDEAEELAPQITCNSRRRSDELLQVTGMTDLTEESISRKRYATRLWQNRSMRPLRARRRGSTQDGSEKVITLMNSYPITNEETHYAVVMDPTEGKVVWAKRYLKPATAMTL